MPECVKEIARLDGPVDGEVWHLVHPTRPYDPDVAWSRPIACSETEGVLLPGPSRDCDPTCADCMTVWIGLRAPSASTRTQRSVDP